MSQSGAALSPETDPLPRWPRTWPIVLTALAVLVVVPFFAWLAGQEWKDVPVSTPTRVVTIRAADTIGQTFVSRHAGLQGIDLYLSGEDAAGNARVTLHLRTSPQLPEADLRTSEAVVDLSSSAWRHFAFPPVGDSQGRSFYFYVEAEEGATIRLGGASASAYHDGSSYLSHRPEDGQLTFALRYGSAGVARDLLVFLMQAFRLLIVGGLLFVIPGLALQSYMLPMPAGAWRERLGISVGLSLSVYPILLAWAEVIGIHLGTITMYALVVASSGALLNRLYRWWTHRMQRHEPAAPGNSAAVRDISGFAWAFAVTIVFLTRIFVLRSVDAPMWGDSVQHAVIGQLIVDNGGLFDSWQPYAPYSSLSVHIGFHSLIASLMWFGNEGLLSATLLAGQVVGFCSVFTLGLLATCLTRNRWAGVGVVVVVGLLTPLPNAYVNWGRYPQLMGQAIVPAAAWLVWRLLDDVKASWRIAPLAAITFAGIALSYYRMPHYVAVFVLALVATRLTLHLRGGVQKWLRPSLGLFFSGALSIVILLPWVGRLPGSMLAGTVEHGLVEGSSLDTVLRSYSAFSTADSFLPSWLAVLAIAATLFSLLRRQYAPVVIALWAGGILLLPAARLLRVPGANSIDGFAVLISLYMPLGLLAGYLIDGVLGWSARQGWHITTCALVLLALSGLLGARDRVNAVDLGYRLLAPADLKAMEWIRENVPSDSLFLVDGFAIMDGRSVVGSDAGWWIPVLTGRPNTMPPQYALLAEKPVDPGYNEFVVNLVAQLRRVGVTSPEGVALLCNSNVAYVYTGQEQGRVGVGAPEPLLSTIELERSPSFESVYRQDKVGVFELAPLACP